MALKNVELIQEKLKSKGFTPVITEHGATKIMTFSGFITQKQIQYLCTIAVSGEFCLIRFATLWLINKDIQAIEKLNQESSETIWKFEEKTLVFSKSCSGKSFDIEFEKILEEYIDGIAIIFQTKGEDNGGRL